MSVPFEAVMSAFSRAVSSLSSHSVSFRSDVIASSASKSAVSIAWSCSKASVADLDCPFSNQHCSHSPFCWLALSLVYSSGWPRMSKILTVLNS